MGKNWGFTLMEVLVSVFVLAVGLLGLAALQANVVKYNHSAELRSLAVLQAEAMIDRMRVNQTGVAGGVYNNLSGIPSSPPDCTSSTCTMSQIATRDLYDWNAENARLLPAGQGTTVGNGSLFTVTVRWDNGRTGAVGTDCSGDLNVDLSCLIVGVEL